MVPGTKDSMLLPLKYEQRLLPVSPSPVCGGDTLLWDARQAGEQCSRFNLLAAKRAGKLYFAQFQFLPNLLNHRISFSEYLLSTCGSHGTLLRTTPPPSIGVGRRSALLFPCVDGLTMFSPSFPGRVFRTEMP